ncbi:MAG: hypothetical protein LBT38_02220 [Deltaproteobacteria bacterium]|jgi:hypothetical protein|nr:hypothetical protein [Deltaproteobacteria bacterium]
MVSLVASNDSLPGKLVSALYEGQKQQTELALKTIQLVAEQQIAMQRQQTTLQAVALLTGVGGKLDIIV